MKLRTGLWIPSEVIERAMARIKNPYTSDLLHEEVLDALRRMIMEELEAEQ